MISDYSAGLTSIDDFIDVLRRRWQNPQWQTQHAIPDDDIELVGRLDAVTLAVGLLSIDTDGCVVPWRAWGEEHGFRVWLRTYARQLSKAVVTRRGDRSERQEAQHHHALIKGIEL